jgi:hypothetical protein
MSLYNVAGFFEPNDGNANSINNLTATSNADGGPIWTEVHLCAVGSNSGRPGRCDAWDRRNQMGDSAAT